MELRRPALPLLPFVSLAMAACGGNGGNGAQARVTSPFTTEHARFFDDAVDLIREPEALGGRWAEEWDEELRGRTGYADLIARVVVQTLRTDTDLEHRNTYHLVCRINETLQGESPGEEVQVSVSEGSGGFETVARNERRIVDARFVLFLKWYADDAGEVKSHWHLTPATRSMVEQVKLMIADARRREEEGGE